MFPTKALRTFCYSMVHPNLLYGLVIWGTSCKTHLKRIYTLQNRAVRSRVTLYYVQLNILKLNKLTHNKSAKIMYKYIQNSIPVTFTSLYTPVSAIYTRTTRGA